jgi:cephalosporin-C deacetylase
MTAGVGEVEQYWARVDEELARQPARPALERLPRHCTDESDLFAVRLTSSGPYRLSGYLSVPRRHGPFPALFQLPRYGSVNEVPHWNDRLRYVVLTVMHRGQRRSDDGFAAAYPGLLTERIEDPESCALRGVLADCLRGLEFLLASEEVDPQRVAVRGSDLGLLVAARRPSVRAVVVESQFLYRAGEARRRSDAYPLEELNDHVRADPASEPALERTLSLFDPLRHAPSVQAAVLLGVGDEGELDGRPWLDPLLESLAGRVETYPITYRGGVDTDWFDAWLARQLGTAARSRFLDEPLG